MNRILSLLVLSLCALVSTAREPVRAITAGQDVIGGVTSVFNVPPNSAQRPNGANGNGGGNGSQPSFTSDLGPGPTDPLESAPIEAFPWVVALTENRQAAQESYICAGVLIAPNWVLTAAHCTAAKTRSWPVDSEMIVLTKTSVLHTPGPAVAVTKVVPHPNYNARTHANDLALLRIEGEGAAGITTIRLDGPPIKDQEGTIAQILGWGISNKTLMQRALSDHLQILQAAVVGARCYSSGNYPRLRGTGVFCAESVLKYHDTCYRFGGGPVLLHDAAGERYLGGLVSWPAVCPPDVRKPNVYLDIQFYLPWIRSVIGGVARSSP